MKANLKALRKSSPKVAQRAKRKISVRKKISGTAECPRLSVFRSARHIYVQAIDDATNVTLASASTVEKDVRSTVVGVKKKDAASQVGAALAKRLIEKGVKAAVFDRNGFRYHGRVAAVADGAREAGLEF
ncbi:MAG: 50S ribosomal protein L18 [Myxococcota bacterium]|jgi:large subunit ribosomal protein L18